MFFCVMTTYLIRSPAPPGLFCFERPADMPGKSDDAGCEAVCFAKESDSRLAFDGWGSRGSDI